MAGSDDTPGETLEFEDVGPEPVEGWDDLASCAVVDALGGGTPVLPLGMNSGLGMLGNARDISRLNDVVDNVKCTDLSEGL